MSVITWVDGAMKTIQDDDPRLAERERQRVLLMNVFNMRRLDIHGRRDYLLNVERREGTEARAALERAFAADWESRRAAG